MAIRRNAGRTLVFMAIVLVLGSVISGAISVRQAILNTDANLRGDLPSVAIVEMDRHALDEHKALTGQQPENLSSLSMQLLDKIGALPQVRGYDYSVGAQVYSDKLKTYDGNNSAVSEPAAEGGWIPLTLKGVRSAELFEVEEGIIEMVSGRMLTTEEARSLSYVALISQNFAHTNSLHVGSRFILDNIVWDVRGDTAAELGFNVEQRIYSRQTCDFEVVGIFVPKVEYNTGDEWIDADFLSQLENRIYVPNQVSMDIMRYQMSHVAEMYPDEVYWQADIEDLVWIQNIYILNEPKDADSFRIAVEEMTPEYYTATFTSDSYRKITSPIESLEKLSLVVLLAAIVASILIFGLLTTLFLRDRKHEIGILLALGEHKRKIIIQVIIETLAVALLAIILALFVGNIFSGSVSESMLRDSLIANNSSNQGMSFSTIDYMGYSNNASVNEILGNYDVSLDVSTTLVFFIIGIGTVVVATILPMFYIVRLNPKKILM